MNTTREGDQLNQPNVIRIPGARARRAGFEAQRQRAVEALRVAAVEFHKLEEFASGHPARRDS
jgi:hypothetical protein